MLPSKSVSKKITSVVNHNLAWHLSPEKQLLELWVSEPMIRNEGKTYDKLIDSLGLKMKSIEALAFEDLLKIDRPGIVNLIEHPLEQAVLLTEINSTKILLATGSSATGR